MSKLEVIPSRTGAEDVGLEVQASGDIIVEVVVQVDLNQVVLSPRPSYLPIDSVIDSVTYPVLTR